MALIKVPFNTQSYTALSTDIDENSRIAGASVVGAVVYIVDTGKRYVIKDDLTLSEMVGESELSIKSLVAYGPVGTHTTLTGIAAATPLEKPAGATQVLIQASGQNIRFTLDNTAPTTTKGFLITAGSDPIIIAVPGETIIQFIQVAATAVLQYQWLS